MLLGNPNCNHYADNDDVPGLTHVINGGENGLQERISCTGHAKAALGGAATPQAPSVAIIGTLKLGDKGYGVSALQQKLASSRLMAISVRRQTRQSAPFSPATG